MFTNSLVGIGLTSYTGANYNEQYSDMSLILTESGFYPKNRDKMIIALNATKVQDVWAFAMLSDQSDLEFLQDKIKPSIFRELLYMSFFKMDQIKNFVELGFGAYNFNHCRIIRRTYEDFHKIFIPVINRNIPYTKPKNPKEKKYYEMLNKTYNIYHINWKNYIIEISIIFIYIKID